jgi:hypothetical protein
MGLQTMDRMQTITRQKEERQLTRHDLDGGCSYPSSSAVLPTGAAAAAALGHSATTDHLVTIYLSI